jgi:hypothetical protein
LVEQSALLELRIARQQSEPASTAEAPDLSTLTYGINRNLKDRNTIQKKLLELNVLGTTFFGVHEPAEGRTVGISRRLSREYIRSVIALARDLKFENYNFIRSSEVEIEEDVLFGTYGKPEFDINR